MLWSVLNTFALLLTAIGVIATFKFARDASRDAAEADRMLRMLLRALHNSDLAEVKFDPDGRPVGLTIHASGNLTLPRITAHGAASVTGPGSGPVDGSVASDEASATHRQSDGSEA